MDGIAAAMRSTSILLGVRDCSVPFQESDIEGSPSVRITCIHVTTSLLKRFHSILSAPFAGGVMEGSAVTAYV